MENEKPKCILTAEALIIHDPKAELADIIWPRATDDAPPADTFNPLADWPDSDADSFDDECTALADGLIIETPGTGFFSDNARSLIQALAKFRAERKREDGHAGTPENSD